MGSITKKVNREFARASDKDKRIMIARDVIAQVKIGSYIPRSVYYSIGSPEDDHCRCCGIGSCLVSLTRHEHSPGNRVGQLVHNLQIEDYIGHMVWNPLIEIFGKNQLALIEEFFEYTPRILDANRRVERAVGIKFRYEATEEEYAQLLEAKEYFHGFDRWGSGMDEHLIQIMENIIRNDGTFNPVEEIAFQTKPAADPVISNLSEKAAAFREGEQRPVQVNVQQQDS